MARAASPVALSSVKAAWSKFARPALYWVGLIPAGWAFYQGFTDQLGAEPIKTLEQILGLWALRFLVLGLTITPLRQIAKVNLLRYRRALGLLAFFYAAMHLGVYVLLDQSLDLGAIWADIVKRPYITVGMFAFLVLVPLAITSNNTMIRRMGGAAWAKLHKLVYVAVPAVAIHFIMVVKAWHLEPLVYAALIAALLGYRVVRYFQAKSPSLQKQARGATVQAGL